MQECRVMIMLTDASGQGERYEAEESGAAEVDDGGYPEQSELRRRDAAHVRSSAMSSARLGAQSPADGGSMVSGRRNSMSVRQNCRRTAAMAVS